MHLAVISRPDIAYSVSFMSQFNHNCNGSHWKSAKRILRYLKSTKYYKLKFCKGQNGLEGYVDADWAGNVQDRKSYTGFVFLQFAGSAISWESRKQKNCSFVKLWGRVYGNIWIRNGSYIFKNFLYEITRQLFCIPLFNDNQTAQKLDKNDMFHKRSKHIDVRHHFVRNAVAEKLIDLLYLQTADITADIFTKSVCFVKHDKLVKELGLA